MITMKNNNNLWNSCEIQYVIHLHKIRAFIHITSLIIRIKKYQIYLRKSRISPNKKYKIITNTKAPSSLRRIASQFVSRAFFRRFARVKRWQRNTIKTSRQLIASPAWWLRKLLKSSWRIWTDEEFSDFECGRNGAWNGRER